MKYFIDTEFHEYQKQPKILGLKVGKPIDTIELISIGIVAEDGREYYAVCNEFDVEAAWDNKWLRKNVLTSIWTEINYVGQFSKASLKIGLQKNGKSKKQIAEEIKFFTSKHLLSKDPLQIEADATHKEFYAYYADYDWVVFCWLFGRMIDLPKGFPMYCRDLKQCMDDKLLRMSNREIGNLSGDVFLSHSLQDSIDTISLDLKIDHVKKSNNYPKQNNEHNALSDARWNKELYKFINNELVTKL